MSLYEDYKNNVVKQLMEKCGFVNVNQVPKVTKISINAGISRDKEREVFKEATEVLSSISGQRPVTTKAKKAISNFKLRDGDPVGVKVTLHGKKMYDFLFKLMNISLPRVRDFRGVSAKAFDGAGNYTLGINDHSIFTEVNVDKVKHTIGMDITIVTSAKTDKEARELLTLLGMPFVK